MKRWWPWLLVVACLVPAASAAQLEFGAPVVTEVPVLPDRGVATVKVPAMYQCEADEVDAANGLVLALDQPPMPRGTILSGSFQYPIPAEACQGPLSKPWRQDLFFNLTATALAAGEKPLAATLQGRVSAAGAVRPTVADASASVSVPFSVRYVGMLTATVSNAIGEAGPGRPIDYRITLTNLGNANTNVVFALAGPVPPGWAVTVPTPVVVGPSQQAGGQDYQRAVTLTVTTPAEKGFGNNQTAFQLRIRPVSTVDPSQEGKEVAVNVLARSGGCPDPSLPCVAASPPAAGPLLAFALLGCAVVARRRAPA
jgi:hypothetical protein